MIHKLRGIHNIPQPAPWVSLFVPFLTWLGKTDQKRNAKESDKPRSQGFRASPIL